VSSGALLGQLAREIRFTKVTVRPSWAPVDRVDRFRLVGQVVDQLTR